MVTTPTWTYDVGNLSGTDATAVMTQIRRLIGDVQTGDKQIYDQEIFFFMTQRPNLYGCAADCCRSIAAQFSRQADVAQGDIHTAYSQRARAYEARAAQFDKAAASRGPGVAFAGGISEQDKVDRAENPDRVPGSFGIGMTDNTLPVAPAGNEMPGGNQDPEIF